MPSNPKAVRLLDLSRFPAPVSDAFLRRQNRTSNVTPPPVIDTFSRTERAPIPNAPALPSASLPVSDAPPTQVEHLSSLPAAPCELQFNGTMNTLQLRGGTHSEAMDPGAHCAPGFGGDWSARLEDYRQPGPHLTCRVAEDIPDGPLIQSGTIKPEIVPWENGQGFTLLVDICHAAQADGAHPFRVGTEWVRLHLQVGGRPIRVRYPSRVKPHADQWSQGSGHKPGDDCLVPQGFRTQVAIPFSKAALLTKYPNLTDRDVVSVEPAFGSAEARTFHSNNPHTVTLPGEMFKKGGELKRMEWAEVPTNGYGSLAGVNSPFLTMDLASDLQPKVVTSMETEAEFTLAGAPATAERALLEMLKTIDSMAQTGGVEDPAAKARLEDFLGASLLKGCQWHLERKANKYEVTDANNEPLADPKGFDISPVRPELAELGLGRPGILYDTYLHVGPGGVIRQRDNFAKEGVVSVKGGHKRQGPFMVRYNRQVECNKELPVQAGGLSRGPELEALLYSDAVNFQDCLFNYPSSGALPQAWTPESGPCLSPKLRVKSERYRYLFVRKQQGGADNRPVMIELSFDLSTGQALDAQGNPKGSPVQTVGFEFGLDHLGASAGKEMNEERAEGTQAPKSNAPGSSAGPQKGLKQPSGPVLHRTWHDRLDLDHPTLFTRPAFTLFAELVSTVTPKLCSTLPINVAGEKAATMMTRLQAGESAEASPGESAATIFKNTP